MQDCNPSDENSLPVKWHDYHPVLRSMRSTCEHLFEAGDYQHAFPVLHAVILLKSKTSFLCGSVHQHFCEEADRE